MNKKLVPRLRFKGFNDEWQHTQLSNIGKVKNFKRIFKSDTSDKANIPFYKIGSFGKFPTTYITKNKFLEYKNKFAYPKIGDILISASGTLGRTVVYRGQNAYYQDSNIVWIDINKEKILNSFLLQFYKIVHWGGVEGSTIKRLYNRTILNTLINIPNLSEQQHIGDFFAKLDRMIELQSKKITHLKQLKKGYLQKIFPQKDKNVPRLRFDGFRDEWNKNQLSKFVSIKTGNKNAEDNVKNGKYAFFDRSTQFKYLNTYDYDEKVIVYPGEGAQFLPKYFNGKYSLHQRAYGLYNFNDINPIYLYYFLNTQSNTFVRFSVGTTAKSLRKDTFKHILVNIPSVQEQNKIGEFFRYLDKLIEQQNNKLHRLKYLKKAYLQKMFI